MPTRPPSSSQSALSSVFAWAAKTAPAPLLLLSHLNPLTRKGHAASVRRQSRQRLRCRWASNGVPGALPPMTPVGAAPCGRPQIGKGRALALRCVTFVVSRRGGCPHPPNALSFAPSSVSSSQAAYRSPRHKCHGSFTPQLVLSHLNPLRWASNGVPGALPPMTPRAHDMRPYRIESERQGIREARRGKDGKRVI